jgi:hypothetical protein
LFSKKIEYFFSLAKRRSDEVRIYGKKIKKIRKDKRGNGEYTASRQRITDF